MLVLKAIIGLLYVVLIAISLFMFLNIFSHIFPPSEASPSPYTLINQTNPTIFIEWRSDLFYIKKKEIT